MSNSKLLSELTKLIKLAKRNNLTKYSILTNMVQILRRNKKNAPMNKLIHKLLSILKEHVNQNNKEIQLNQEEIDKLLSDISLITHKKDLDAKYLINKELLDENSDFIKMQLALSEFLEKYKYLFQETVAEKNPIEPEEMDSRKLFNLTVNGKLKFDSAHPQFNDPQFFQELLRYYEIHENYEMCDKLLKQRML